MSLILKCDGLDCSHNSYNYNEPIWELSPSLQNQFSVEHLCSCCVESQLKGNGVEVSLNYADKILSEGNSDSVQATTSVVTIYSDGACKGNPGLSGSGLAIYKDGKKPVLMYGDFNPNGTNNSAELLAMLSAIKIAKEEVDVGNTVKLLSDSRYSIDCITKWAKNWESKGWTKKGGKISNLEIIQEAYHLYNSLSHSLTIDYVKAHSGIEGNELADRAAGLAILKNSINYSTHEYELISDVLSL